MRRDTLEYSKFKIFVLDDDQDFVDLISLKLKRFGYSVAGSTDPIETLEKLKEERFDLLLLDFAMAPINGAEFISRLRMFNQQLHIILLTGVDESSSPAIEAIRELDIQGYCRKADGELSRLLMDVFSAYKIVMQRRILIDYKEKLKKIIEFMPRFFNVQKTEVILSEMIRKVTGLFGVSDGFLLVNNICNETSSDDDEDDISKSIYSGIGKYDFEVKSFLNKLDMEFVSKIGVVSFTKQLTKTKDGLLLPLYSSQFPNIGMLYIEMKDYDDYNELLWILSHQLASILGNAFLYQMSVTDGLTGVYNRLYIENFLIKNEFEKTNRSDICVAIIDIDDFKKVNDCYGHPNGDIVLKGVADVLKDTVRKSDIVARYGGEEFIVVFTCANLKEATIASEKILKNICTSWFRFEQHGEIVEIQTSVSIGVASFMDHDSYLQLLDATDKALYMAKTTGKARVCSSS